ncbi:hypothetical protein [Streptomyces sp. H27-S2]|uniref:hypothetical protein n=1 Tax=Streptomyces antarcticus TaxID=2996458 RepID=UPI002270E7A0|nr:hypothetical protein [Streptomyces sp. H27-S2]MCY0952095.1 hypothetical protein [Streptomyces sp. H27-S2]
MQRDTAAAELAEARALLDTMTERVREGDPDVTPEQLATQRELIAFAELRVEAAQRKETRVRAEERVTLAGAAREAAEQLLTGPGTDELTAATRDAVDALARLAGLVNERNERIAEIGSTLVQLDTDLKAAGETTGAWGTRKFGVWGNRDGVTVDGIGRAEALPMGRLSVAVTVAGLGEDNPGRAAQEQHMKSFNGLRHTTVQHLIDTFPALRDAVAPST